MEIKRSNHTSTKADAEAVAEEVLFGEHKASNRTREFENNFSKLIGVKYAKAISSGTNALFIALSSLGIKAGDEVILPSYVCQSVMSAVNYTGAKPVPADIDKDFSEKGFNISQQTIKPLITKKTKAIILPHMFGVPANIDEIKKLNIPIIEDCAHSLGAKYKGKPVGSFGDLAIFSFYSTKVISTGHGGMIVTNSKTLKDKIDDLMHYDGRKEYKIAYNFSFSDIQAALGLSQLKQLPSFLERRDKIAKRYYSSLANTPLVLPPKINGSIEYRFIIRTKDKSSMIKLQKSLKVNGVGADTPVFKPLHQYLNLNKKDFPNTEKAQETSLALPLYPSLKDEEVDYVISSVKEILSK